MVRNGVDGVNGGGAGTSACLGRGAGVGRLETIGRRPAAARRRDSLPSFTRAATPSPLPVRLTVQLDEAGAPLDEGDGDRRFLLCGRRGRRVRGGADAPDRRLERCSRGEKKKPFSPTDLPPETLNAVGRSHGCGRDWRAPKHEGLDREMEV